MEISQEGIVYMSHGEIMSICTEASIHCTGITCKSCPFYACNITANAQIIIRQIDGDAT